MDDIEPSSAKRYRHSADVSAESLYGDRSIRQRRASPAVRRCSTEVCQMTHYGCLAKNIHSENACGAADAIIRRFARTASAAQRLLREMSHMAWEAAAKSLVILKVFYAAWIRCMNSHSGGSSLLVRHESVD